MRSQLLIATCLCVFGGASLTISGGCEEAPTPEVNNYAIIEFHDDTDHSVNEVPSASHEVEMSLLLPQSYLDRIGRIERLSAKFYYMGSTLSKDYEFSVESTTMAGQAHFMGMRPYECEENEELKRVVVEIERQSGVTRIEASTIRDSLGGKPETLRE